MIKSSSKLNFKILFIIITIVFIIVIAWKIYTSFILTHFNTISKEGQKAIDFTFTDVTGKKYKLSDFKGKVILIDFMAIWCGPCEKQVNILKNLYPMFSGKVIFLSLSVDSSDTLEKLKSYKENHKIPWMVGRAPEAADKYGITAIPTIVIINKNFKIVFKSVGVTSEDTLRNVLSKALQGN